MGGRSEGAQSPSPCRACRARGHQGVRGGTRRHHLQAATSRGSQWTRQLSPWPRRGPTVAKTRDGRADTPLQRQWNGQLLLANKSPQVTMSPAVADPRVFSTAKLRYAAKANACEKRGNKVCSAAELRAMPPTCQCSEPPPPSPFQHIPLPRMPRGVRRTLPCTPARAARPEQALGPSHSLNWQSPTVGSPALTAPVQHAQGTLRANTGNETSLVHFASLQS